MGARIAGWIALLALAGLLGFGAALHQSWIRLPPNWAPWSAVRLDAPPSWFARMQINGLAADPAACFAALDRSGLEYRRLPERPLEDGCGLPDGGARPERALVPYSGGFDASCPLAAALRWYEAGLTTLAARHFGEPLARIDHLGSYACRNVYAREEGRRSQHATANAIDIAGFRLRGGTRISVLDDWGTDTPAGRFLEDAHDEACRFFNAVLGPDYNAAHANHFHLDLGRARICR